MTAGSGSGPGVWSGSVGSKTRVSCKDSKLRGGGVLWAFSNITAKTACISSADAMAAEKRTDTRERIDTRAEKNARSCKCLPRSDQQPRHA